MGHVEVAAARGYEPPPGYDEMVAPDGAARPAWTRVKATLLDGDSTVITRSAARIERRLHHPEIGDEDTGPRRWPLDPVPMIIERSDWAAVGRGLAQRAQALDLILADVFGEQRLLRSGMLPTDAILADRDYLRPCVGLRPAGGHHLLIHAANVGRNPEGSFVVLSGHTQNPSGMGETLENREVLASTYPGLIRRVGIEPLRPWFSALRLNLARVAPEGVEDPRIIVLSTEASSVARSEHGYLARTLGYTLAEPADLTVREGRVWIKSVSGLEPVHVILRHFDAQWADSLELRADSSIGIPGLLEAIRRGNVSVVNALGSGLAENPALLPYLDRIIIEVLGEEPLLESAPTWWCGDPAGRSHVLANLDTMVIKPIDNDRGIHTSFGWLLDRFQTEELRERILANPHLFVGQEEQPLSSVPTFVGEALQPMAATVRAFLVSDGEEFRWMDGGLTRVTPMWNREGTATIGGTTDSMTKDTWITSPNEERSWTVRRTLALPQVDLRDSVTSHAAESMYWLGRNIERCDSVIRLVRAVDENLRLWPDLRDEGDGEWIRSTTEMLRRSSGNSTAEPFTVFTDPIQGALTDRSLPQSLVSSLSYLTTGARSVRERLSNDSWRMVTQLESIELQLLTADTDFALELAEAAITPLNAMSGLLLEVMVRDAGWRFLDLGRRVERSLRLCDLLGAVLGTTAGPTVMSPLYETLLAAWECLGAYRRYHRFDIELEAVIAILMTNGDNPRSLRFQVDRMIADLNELPNVEVDGPSLRARVRALGDMIESWSPRTLAQEFGTGAGQHRYDSELARIPLDFSLAVFDVAELVEMGFFAQVGDATIIGSDTIGGR